MQYFTLLLALATFATAIDVRLYQTGYPGHCSGSAFQCTNLGPDVRTLRLSPYPHPQTNPHAAMLRPTLAEIRRNRLPRHPIRLEDQRQGIPDLVSQSVRLRQDRARGLEQAPTGLVSPGIRMATLVPGWRVHVPIPQARGERAERGVWGTGCVCSGGREEVRYYGYGAECAGGAGCAWSEWDGCGGCS
jgi:hypothetical protein